MPLLQYLRVDILAGANPLACHADMDRILASAESPGGSPLQYYGILAVPSRITACSLFLQNNSPVHAYRARIWLGTNLWATHHLRPGGACTVPGLLAAVQNDKGVMMKVEWHQARFLSGQDRGPVPVKRRVVGTNATDLPNVPYDVGGMLWELLEAAPSTVFELECSALIANMPSLVPSASCSAIQQPPRSTTTRMSQSSANLPITTGMTTRSRTAAAYSPPPPSWSADFLRPSNVIFPPTALAPPSQPTREVVELLDSDDDLMDVDDDDEPIVFTPVTAPPAALPAAPACAPVRSTRPAVTAAPSRTTMTPPLATTIRIGTARAAAMQRAKPEVIEIDFDSD